MKSALKEAPQLKSPWFVNKIFVHYIEYDYKTKGKQHNHLIIDYAEILSPSKLDFAHGGTGEIFVCPIERNYWRTWDIFLHFTKLYLDIQYSNTSFNFLGSTCSERVGMIPKTIYGQ